jgi:hypothetical protein
LALLNPLIQGLEHARIHRGDDIHGGIQFFLGHPAFPCVRKAAFYSWIAEAHHRDGQADEHLFAVGETLDSMGVTIELAKISSLQIASLLSALTPVSRLVPGKSPFHPPFLQRGKEGGFETRHAEL